MKTERWELYTFSVVGVLLGVEIFCLFGFFWMEHKPTDLAAVTCALTSALAGGVIVTAVAVARNVFADFMRGREKISTAARQARLDGVPRALAADNSLPTASGDFGRRWILLAKPRVVHPGRFVDVSALENAKCSGRLLSPDLTVKDRQLLTSSTPCSNASRHPSAISSRRGALPGMGSRSR
jgi:hypothetical protein